MVLHESVVVAAGVVDASIRGRVADVDNAVVVGVVDVLEINDVGIGVDVDVVCKGVEVEVVD